MEHPIKMDDLGVPLFSETSIYTQLIFRNALTFSSINSSASMPILDLGGLDGPEGWQWHAAVAGHLTGLDGAISPAYCVGFL